jgi:hypothetical protein
VESGDRGTRDLAAGCAVFLKVTDVDPALSAAPYRRRDLTDLATVLSNLATYSKRNKKKIRAKG